ncbi:GNAT family N-acetyltransferase, partial [Candidatus Poribacteria bacterium]|nr:GNAT family N-acetyltransferase [Candidatus Poribacteria bacterium]
SMKHVATLGTLIDDKFLVNKIGRSLAEASFTFAKTKNFEKISIQVLADNTRALRFYGNLGFEKIGVAKKHVKFEDRFCDVFYLEKFLTDDS